MSQHDIVQVIRSRDPRIDAPYWLCIICCNKWWGGPPAQNDTCEEDDPWPFAIG